MRIDHCLHFAPFSQAGIYRRNFTSTSFCFCLSCSQANVIEVQPADSDFLGLRKVEILSIFSCISRGGDIIAAASKLARGFLRSRFPRI